MSGSPGKTRRSVGRYRRYQAEKAADSWSGGGELMIFRRIYPHCRIQFEAQVIPRASLEHNTALLLKEGARARCSSPDARSRCGHPDRPSPIGVGRLAIVPMDRGARKGDHSFWLCT